MIDRLSITFRRSADGELPTWVRIKNLNGVSVNLRRGSSTSPAEFDELLEAAKMLMRGAP